MKKCRFCHNEQLHGFIDLNNSPASNSYLRPEQLEAAEVFYPLNVFVCEACFLVQVDEYKKATDIFSEDYAYFSSYSKSWLAHSQRYVEMMTERFGFNKKSQIMEIASNDGYLLQYFHEKKIPVLGIEPTLNTAEVARAKGIETLVEFFGVSLAKRLLSEGKQADLLLGNNVLAHVPDLNDFVGGMPIILKDKGIITMEFPHLMQLVAQNQFDTIYHEHFSYLSLLTVQQIFAKHSLEIFDVEEIPTHGGSLRIFARHAAYKKLAITERVGALLAKEKALGMDQLAYYEGFQAKANRIKYDLLGFLLEQKKAGRRVAAYGAAAKGNTLLNYCGIKSDMIDFVCDLSPHKQGKFLPASHIPVVSEAFLQEQQPDYVLILPWNIKDEITEQLAYIRDWHGKFVVAIPELHIW